MNLLFRSARSETALARRMRAIGGVYRINVNLHKPGAYLSRSLISKNEAVIFYLRKFPATLKVQKEIRSAAGLGLPVIVIWECKLPSVERSFEKIALEQIGVSFLHRENFVELWDLQELLPNAKQNWLIGVLLVLQGLTLLDKIKTSD